MGETVAKKLAHHFTTIDNLMHASFDELNKSKKQINELLGVPVFLPLSSGVDEIVRFIKDKIIK